MPQRLPIMSSWRASKLLPGGESSHACAAFATRPTLGNVTGFDRFDSGVKAHTRPLPALGPHSAHTCQGNATGFDTCEASPKAQTTAMPFSTCSACEASSKASPKAQTTSKLALPKALRCLTALDHVFCFALVCLHLFVCICVLHLFVCTCFFAMMCCTYVLHLSFLHLFFALVFDKHDR